MAVDQQKKRAMKRLMLDLEELQREPVANVSAAPLDENMFEWHCNFKCDDIIYHLILYLPHNYPYDSPSAEFVPVGFRYNSGATMPGKKGIKVCLNIFADFAFIHTEWKDQKGLGWSPGYTIQTILLNVVAFLAETQSGDSSWMKDTANHNLKLSKGFSCDDCGHNFKKPFPPLDAGAPEKPSSKKAGKKGKDEPTGTVPVCYISKEKFKTVKPKSNEELFGYGLIVSGPSHRPSLTTPCEFLTLEHFHGMKNAVGKVHSVMKEEIQYFLPLYIHPIHGSTIKNQFETTLNEVAKILPKCKPNKTPIEEMIIKVVPNLMSATVVEFSKGTQHTSDNALNGYFALHRLLLWALETYPELEKEVDRRLKVFIDDESNRSKKACPHIGEWLMLLSASWKYRWQEAAEAYLSESWKRNVMWYVKEDSKLGMLDTDKAYRLRETYERTKVSRKLLAFQVLFLDIAMPKGKSRKELIRRYDDNLGFPTPDMVKDMKDSVQRIEKMASYADWYNVLKIKPLTEQQIFDRLVKCVEYSIYTDGYNWSFWKTGGGWGEVLRRYKPYTPKEKKTEGEASGSGKGKGEKAKGKGAAEKPKPAAKGKGAAEKPKPAAKGKGRGKKAMEVDSESESEEEEVKPAPKGRGRGKRKAEEPAVGARGGKRKR